MECNSLKHIAIIMDGNGRWATNKALPRTLGHNAGVKAARNVIKSCMDIDIPHLTLFAFSSENWQRPNIEVKTLMKIFNKALDDEVSKINENNILLKFIGDLSPFEENLREKMLGAQKLTQNNTGLNLNVAVNYGGRWDILNAAKKLAKQVQKGEVKDLDDIDEAYFDKFMSCASIPDPDLLIRTGGEERVSNFLLWQMAYSEIYFTKVLWPDFGKDELLSALEWFEIKQRRYGRVSEQLKPRVLG